MKGLYPNIGMNSVWHVAASCWNHLSLAPTLNNLSQKELLLIDLLYRWSCQSNRNKHTYIIGDCNPSVRIIDLISHTAYVVCVNFIQKWRDLKFNVDSERQIFWETFHGNFYWFSEFLPKICWEEIAKEILFVFCFDVWPGARTLVFRLISQHTTY